MRSLLHEVRTHSTPEEVAEQFRGEPGVVLLRSAFFDSPQARYSFLAARPFLTFRANGSQCEIRGGPVGRIQFGNPWRLLESLISRYELLDEIDLPFPLGGCFGYWGYDLKNFVEPKLPRRAVSDLELPDCALGFYDSLVVFDHLAEKTWVVSTGLDVDGSRSRERAEKRVDFWSKALEGRARSSSGGAGEEARGGLGLRLGLGSGLGLEAGREAEPEGGVGSNISREGFIERVERAQEYIRAGDIYQVNLSHRLAAEWKASGWELFRSLTAASPAPFAAYLDCGDFQIVSSSPELFLRLSGSHVQTRPIKGTRPRAADATRDAQLTYELQTSAKEMAELVMITDLLRNDLGRVCEFGSVHVPELARLERFSQVQHLVSTVEGRLRPEVSHSRALASCFPGGSITGAPKFRAMEIIDELEPVSRGPYTGALGYLGFNRESQLSILIRAAVLKGRSATFHVGAGVVADSTPAAEYEETVAKGQGFFRALSLAAAIPQVHPPPPFGAAS